MIFIAKFTNHNGAILLLELLTEINKKINVIQALLPMLFATWENMGKLITHWETGIIFGRKKGQALKKEML